MTPVGGGTSAPPISKDVARSDAQSMLSTLQVNPLGFGGQAILGVVRRVLGRRTGLGVRALGTVTFGSGTCAPDGSGHSTSTVSTTNPAGDSITTTTIFYDANCVHPESVMVDTTPANAPTTDNITLTTYDPNGVVIRYATVAASSITNGNTATLTFRETDATTVGGTPFVQFGTTFMMTLGGGASTAIAHGLAEVSTIGTSPGGFTLSSTDTLAYATSTATVTLNEAFSASIYSGSNLGIAPGAGPAWNVTGGTPIDSLTGTLTATSTATATSGTIAASDALTGLTISGNFSANGMNLTISQGGKIVATVVTDAFGNGTITYADGTTEKVVGFTIAG